MINVSITPNKPAKSIKSIHSLEYFCDLTCRAFQLEDFPTRKILSSRNGWRILADEWDQLSLETDFDVMYDALYTIKWCYFDAKDGNDAYIMLVRSACEELLADTPAHRAWTQLDYFDSIVQNLCTEMHYRTAAHPCCYSMEHHIYVCNELALKIWRCLPGYKRVCNAAIREYEQYRERIIKLIPDAQKRPSYYWLDENHIFDEILKVYNVDYRCNDTDYFCLTCLLANTGAIPGRSNSCALFFLCNLKSFSTGLARAIWNTCDESTFVKLLCLAEKRAERLHNGSVSPRYVTGVKAVGDITYTRLCQSWLFKYVQQQLNEGAIDPRYIKKARKVIFDISMRADGC